MKTKRGKSDYRSGEKKTIRFSKNKAGELLKTKGNGQKQTENKPETKLSKLLKKKRVPNTQSENKPKNKAGHLVENKGPLKNKPKTKWKITFLMKASMVAI